MRRGKAAKDKRRQKAGELAKKRVNRTDQQQLKILDERGVKAVRERKRLEQRIASDRRRQRGVKK